MTDLQLQQLQSQLRYIEDFLKNLCDALSNPCASQIDFAMFYRQHFAGSAATQTPQPPLPTLELSGLYHPTRSYQLEVPEPFSKGPGVYCEKTPLSDQGFQFAVNGFPVTPGSFNEAKYHVFGVIAKRSDGKLVPPTEPLVIFRAQDRLLPDLLALYHDLCKRAGCSKEHLQLIDERIEAVRQWQSENGHKTPDTP